MYVCRTRAPVCVCDESARACVDGRELVCVCVERTREPVCVEGTTAVCTGTLAPPGLVVSLPLWLRSVGVLQTLSSLDPLCGRWHGMRVGCESSSLAPLCGCAGLWHGVRVGCGCAGM